MNPSYLLNPVATAQLGRDVLTPELVPEDYFKRLTRAQLFPGNEPLEIDLGCGDGRFLMAMAAYYPERRFLGVERLLGRVNKVCRRLAREQIETVKILRLETLYTVQWLLPKAAVSRVHLICPDPWPKEKHHKNRIMRRAFLEAVEEILEPGGEFLFRTDHPEYYEWSEREVQQYGGMEVLPWQEGDFFYPKSDFQLHWEAQGKALHNLRCRKPSTS